MNAATTAAPALQSALPQTAPARAVGRGTRQQGEQRPAYPRTPEWWRTASSATAWIVLGIPVLLWLQNGGLATMVSGTTGLLTSTGRITGLVGSALLLVQVLLMARIPLVERSYGQDELARRHRLVGFTSFSLVMAHVVLITVGYALADRAGLVHEVVTLVWSYPGMLIATGGTAALTMVVVTSIRAARARLRYESWHLLHLYAYLGVGLALPHQLWTGTDLLTSRTATAYWWTTYLAAAGAVLVFRLALPLWRSGFHALQVSRVVPEAPGVWSVHLTGRHLERLPVRAGQFFLWRFLGQPGWTRAHPYSVSRAPDGRSLRITVRDLGDGSSAVAHLAPGTTALVEGPFGRLTGDVRQRRRLTMLAGGIGVTPLRALLEELPYAAGDATLVYRATRAQDLLLRTEIEELARHRGIEVFYVLGPRRADGSWLPRSAGAVSDAAALLRVAPHLRDSDVYLCGPDDWMASARAAALAAGVPADQLHEERFAW